MLQSQIKSNFFVEIGRFTISLQKVMPERISNIRMVFVIRNKSRILIFRNDEYAEQKALTKNAHPGSHYELKSIS